MRLYVSVCALPPVSAAGTCTEMVERPCTVIALLTRRGAAACCPTASSLLMASALQPAVSAGPDLRTYCRRIHNKYCCTLLHLSLRRVERGHHSVTEAHPACALRSQQGHAQYSFGACSRHLNVASTSTPWSARLSSTWVKCATASAIVLPCPVDAASSRGASCCSTALDACCELASLP